MATPWSTAASTIGISPRLNRSTFSAISGVTRVGLARMDAGTGAVDQGFDAKLSAPGLSRTRVEHFDISPDGSRLYFASDRGAGMLNVSVHYIELATATPGPFFDCAAGAGCAAGASGGGAVVRRRWTTSSG